MTEIPRRNLFWLSKNSLSQSEEHAMMKEEHWNLGRTRDENQKGSRLTKDTFLDKLICWDPLNFVWDS